MTKEEKQKMFQRLLELIRDTDLVFKMLHDSNVERTGALEQRTVTLMIDFDSTPRLQLSADEAYRVIEFDQRVKFDDELDKLKTYVNGVEVFCLDRKEV